MSSISGVIDQDFTFGLTNAPHSQLKTTGKRKAIQTISKSNNQMIPAVEMN